jgi:hypothetical protein
MEHSTVQDLPWDTKYKTQFNGHIAPPGGPKRAFRAAPPALRSGDVEIEGSKPAVERFLRLFPLPAAPADG